MNAAVRARAPQGINLSQNKSSTFARLTWKNTVFYLTVGTLLAWSLNVGILGGTELDFVPVMTLLRVFFIMALLRVIFISKFTLIFTIAVIAVAAIILGIGALSYISHTPTPYLPPREWPVLFNIGDFVSRVFAYMTGAIPYQPAYDAFIQWTLASFFAVFVFVLGFAWFNFFALLAVSMVTFGLVLNTGIFNFNPAFYVFIFCVISYLIRYLNQRSMRQSANSTSPFVLYALPLTAVCLIFAIALPTPREGAMRNLTENFITRPFTAINNFIQDMLHPRYFSLAQTGFGMGDRRLGGNITANYDRVMRINHRGPVYLTGNILDTYTGYSWTNTFPNDSYVLDFGASEQQLAYFEMRASTLVVASDEIYTDLMQIIHDPFFAMLNNQDIFDLDLGILFHQLPIYRNTLVVEHIFRSFNIFTTGIVLDINPPAQGMELIRGLNGEILSDRLMRREARYTIHYAAFAPGDRLDTTLNASYPGVLTDSYNLMRALADEGFAIDDLYVGADDMQIQYFDLLANHLIPRAQWIHDTYTTLPPHLPSRVGEMARMVATETQATTHFEMATALVNFLRNSGVFSYSLTPGPTPIDRDFVDHFLFDLQIGYCTHFASAFVIMARSLGIPTRYVEGFMVSGGRDDYGYLDVINRQGHAWAEVYFEGFGWQLFEPTPPEAIFAWGQGTDYTGTASPDFLDAVDDFMETHGNRSQGFEDDFLDENIFDDLFGIQIVGEAPTVGAEVANVILYALLVVFALIAALIIGRVIYIGTIDTRISRKSNNESVIANFRRVLRYMSQFEFAIQEHETGLQLAGRVGKRMSFDSDKPIDEKIYMTDLAEVFYRAIYSTADITDADRILLENAVRTLDKRLWAYMGARKYILCKYITGVV